VVNQNQDEPNQDNQPVVKSLAVSHMPTATQSSRRVRLGSLWVTYIDSYYEASQKLLPATSELAYPILYLQRHTFELLTKEILTALLEIRGEAHRLDVLFNSPTGIGPIRSTDFAVAYSKHSFKEIFSSLEYNLKELGFPALPKVFGEARRMFDDVEDGQPDRLRYETVLSKNNGEKRHTPSFPRFCDEAESKYAPCDEMAAVLSQIVAVRKRQLDRQIHNLEMTEDSELDDFYECFWEECRASEHKVANCLHELVEATRKGDVTWREVSSPRLNIEDHPDLKSFASDVADLYVETSFRGRDLVVIVLPDFVKFRGASRSENGYFLTARQPDGTLTLGVWPEDGQSDLIREVILAFRRNTGSQA
jgi:hypothetical protein